MHTPANRQIQSLLLALCVSWPALPTGCAVDEASMEAEAEQDDPTDYPELRACAGEASGADIDAHVELALEFAETTNELSTCGTLTADLCFTMVGFIVSAALQGWEADVPSGWTFDGEGSYRSVAGGTTMDLWMYAGDDYPFASAGDLIPYDVFDPDNYLSGVSIVPDFTNASVELTYTEVGPLVELLGLGANPPNPLTLDDLAASDGELGNITFETAIERRRSTDGGHASSFEVTSPLVQISACRPGLKFSYEIVSAMGSRPELGQSMDVDVWNVEFTAGERFDGHGGTMAGNIEYRMEGGLFEFDVATVFDGNPTSQTTVSCP